jgi:succinate---hydroxymethylglutarate CoA-transferase
MGHSPPYVLVSLAASGCVIANEYHQPASIVPYRSFKTKDGDILFGGGNDRLYGVLCDGIGRPEWKDDPRYNTNAQRVLNRDVLEAEIEGMTRTRTTKEWLDVFEGKGMPYAAVNDVLDTLTHEHTLARNMVVKAEHEYCGPIQMVNTPVKYSDSKPSIRSAPPILGQHTDEILMEHLSMTEDEVKSLKSQGVVS